MKYTIKYNSIFPVLVKVWNWTTCLAPSLPAPNAWSSPRYAPCDASPTSTPSPTSFSHLKVLYSLIVCMSFWGDLAFCSLFFPLFLQYFIVRLHSPQVVFDAWMAFCSWWQSNALGLCRQCVRLHSWWTLNAWMVFLTVTEQSFGFVQAMCQTPQPMNTQCFDGIVHNDRAKFWVCAGNVSDFTADEHSMPRWYFSQWQSKVFWFVQAMCQTPQPINTQCFDGIVHNDRPKLWVCAGNVSDFTADEQSMRGWYRTQWQSKVLGLCRQCVRLHSWWTVNTWMALYTMTDQSFGFVQAMCRTLQPMSCSICSTSWPQASTPPSPSRTPGVVGVWSPSARSTCGVSSLWTG